MNDALRTACFGVTLDERNRLHALAESKGLKLHEFLYELAMAALSTRNAEQPMTQYMRDELEGMAEGFAEEESQDGDNKDG